jgi:hypothetical protein
MRAIEIKASVDAKLGSDRMAEDLASHLEAIIGPPAILPGESRERYRVLYGRIRAAIQPRGMIEELWARDIVDLVWEGARLRQFKVKLMAVSAHRGVQRLLSPLVPGRRAVEEVFPEMKSTSYRSESEILAENWARGDRAAVKRVDAVLAKAGLDNESIMAATLAAKLEEIEAIDRLIMQSEARRNSVLREIDRRREAAGRQLRRVIDDVVDLDPDDGSSNGQENSVGVATTD